MWSPCNGHQVLMQRFSFSSSYNPSPDAPQRTYCTVHGTPRLLQTENERKNYGKRGKTKSIYRKAAKRSHAKRQRTHTLSRIPG